MVVATIVPSDFVEGGQASIGPVCGKTMETTRILEPAIPYPAIAVRPFAPWASSTMQMLEWVVADIAPTAVPVLLVGESGTGKDVVAAEIHARSRRQGGSLLKLACSVLVPGDFDRVFARAGNGNGGTEEGTTVFLDEISELQPGCQTRLLQALSSSDGISGGRDTSFGVISATCHNLEEAMRGGRFLDELYYRLSGVCLRLPPLRHRKPDIPVLAEFFLDKYAALFSQPRPALSADALEALINYPWPGNIRELENVMKRLAALGDESLALSTLAPGLGPGRDRAPFPGGDGQVRSLKEAARAASRQAERKLILQVLDETRWNRKRAAQRLKISYKALLYKLKQIGLVNSAGD